MMSRRPSLTIYDYPEDLNPFKDDNEEIPVKYPVVTGQTLSKDRDNDRKKFWTFGRSKKKRTQSFSLKSTWNGLFGKKKDAIVERKPAISTVSSTYQRASYNDYPIAPSRPSRDHQEFTEALGTLARRRKYTLDSSSRYGSNLTMNGDPGRIYDGCPQETTSSIMGDLTPKPPARRFGHVSPKPTDKIPPLDYGKKDDKDDGTPIPPKRGGFRSSQRLNYEDDGVQLRDKNFTDENENEDFAFKRCNYDAVRKSNLSINSCVSMSSVYYASGRKKRRAPLPPPTTTTTTILMKNVNVLESPKEDEPKVPEKSDEPLAIARVAEDINEMTKRTQELEDVTAVSDSKIVENDDEHVMKVSGEVCEKLEQVSKESDKLEDSLEIDEKINEPSSETFEKDDCLAGKNTNKSTKVIQVEIEYTRIPEKPLEIIKDVNVDDNVVLRRPNSASSSEFSVKEEIEKIEKQIQILESKKQLRTRTTSYTAGLDEDNPSPEFQRGGSRRSLQETRRHFFRDLTSKDDLHIEIKQLPREQNDIKIVRLNDTPATRQIQTSEEPVKVIELHISEPIKKSVESSTDLEINPIPKPRRHTSMQIKSSEDEIIKDDEKENHTN